jgi:hypothetical protein
MRKQVRWLIVVILAVAVAWLAFSAVIRPYAFLYDPTISEIAAEIDDRDVLEGNTGLKIPASATEIHGYVDGFQDVTTLLRFTLPVQDFGTFLQQTSCAQPLYQGDKSTGYSMRNWDKLKWWRPEDAQQFLACADGHKSFGREFFIDTTDADKYLIYVVASTY